MECTNDQTPFTQISLANGRSDRKVKFQQSSWGVKKTKTTKPKWKDQEIRACIQDAGNGACKDQKRRRPPLTKQDTLDQDMDIEEDGLSAIGVEESQLDGPPKIVKIIDPMYVATKFRRPYLRSDSERLTCIFACFSIKTDYSANCLRSQIKIEHHLQDHALGDDFGAEIESYPYKDKYHNDYFLHFFINIEQKSVAQNLTLREYDELVLLNDEFVPSMTHDELIAEFKALPVDSHTPLKLIIRRMQQREHDVKEIKFQWIKIQAILVPEYDREPRTIVTECHTELLSSAPSGTATMCLRLQDSSKYMSIQNHVIGTCLLQGDESDNTARITMNWRILVTPQSAQQTYFLASLCSNQNEYVSVKEQEVHLAEQPFEFTYSKDGGRKLFKVKGPCMLAVFTKFLGYFLIVSITIGQIPQIIKILRKRSASGVSFASMLLLLEASTATVAYALLQGYPVSAWGEHLVVMHMNLILVCLLLRYSNRFLFSFGFLLLYICFTLVVIMPLVSSNAIWYLYVSTMPAVFISRAIQIVKVYRSKDPGQLSATSSFLCMFQCFGRLTTSIIVTGDCVMIANAVVLGVFGILLTLQILYYRWRNKKIT